MGRYLVERYWPGVSEDDAADAADRARSAAEAVNQEGTPVRYVSSELVPAEELFLTTYEATSVAIVERVSRRAGLRIDRINACVELIPRASGGAALRSS